MNEDWYKNPTVLIVAGVAIFGGLILLRNQGSTGTGQQNVGNFDMSNLTTPVGQSYSYLDGSGIQHLVATDPNGNLTSYDTVPPSIATPYAGELSSYVGSLSHYGTGNSSLGVTPPYAWNPSITGGVVDPGSYISDKPSPIFNFPNFTSWNPGPIDYNNMPVQMPIINTPYYSS